MDDGGDNRGILVRDFGVVNVPANGTLRTFDETVGDAVVVGVKDETHGLEGFGEQFVPEQGGLNATVKGFEKTDVKCRNAVFVHNEGSVCGVDVAKDADGIASEFHDDEITHVCVEVGASNVSGGDVTAFVCIDEDGNKEGVGSDSGRRSF